MEDHHAAGPQMACKASKSRCRIGQEHQYVAADDRVEAPLEGHLGRIAIAKRDIAQRPRIDPSTGYRQCARSWVRPDDLTRVTDQCSGKDSDVAGAAADVQHTHSRNDPRITEES